MKSDAYIRHLLSYGNHNTHCSITDNICSYLDGSELFALASTSKIVSESALDWLWANLTTLKDLFALLPGCFEDHYAMVSTKILLFFLFCSNETTVSAVYTTPA